ncbi:unnamed protein product [Rotaria sordida]|uniref:Uncharacterized protein n=1 Tax=Rotaria sordida TaxID=392033 RepID=A0A813QJM2_9BILA|nr:unnamed protein product [Rotaria sordida]
MNILIIFTTIAILLGTKTHSMPIDTYESFDYTSESFPSTSESFPSTSESFPSTSESFPSTSESFDSTTEEITTEITTTLAPEVDREWEDLILGGPTVVNYLGLFMVHASRADQVLTPSDTYTIKYINNVQSLHATLFQISSAMQIALQGARDDLIRTRNSMDQIPEHIKAGLLLIKTAPKDLLSQLLSYILRNIERAAKEGSVATKRALERFVSVGLLVEELAILLTSTLSSSPPKNLDCLVEANVYANDIKIQWNLLVKLFRKFSERANITQTTLRNSFIEPIDQAQKTNGFGSQSDRLTFLDKLIPAAITIDQSSYLLNMMARTYSDVSNDYMINQITSNEDYLDLVIESLRTTSQRQLWQKLVSQSVKVARLAQERHNQFSGTSSIRQANYTTYLKAVLAL